MRIDFSTTFLESIQDLNFRLGINVGWGRAIAHPVLGEPKVEKI